MTEAYAAFVALLGRVGLAPSACLADVTAAGVSHDEAVELLLLVPSFARSDLKLDEADMALATLGEEATFQFQFQKGLNAIARSDFSRALDAFLAARDRARDDEERASSLYNLIICLEDLGLDFHADLAALEKIAPRTEFWSGKLDAMRATDLYRRGELKGLAEIARRGRAEDKLYYFLAWVASHPLYRIFSAHERESEFTRRYTAAGARWVNGYRLRTLKGLALESDFRTDIKISEKIQRLHLWLWRWLVDPTAHLLDRLCQLEKDIFATLSVAPVQTLSYESFQMLENSLRWLALFSDVSNHDAMESIRGVNYTLGLAVASLDYERLYLDSLFARRGGKESIAGDTQLALRDHAMHVCREFPLASSETPEGWERFAAAIEDLIPRPPAGDALVVSPRESSLRRLRNGRNVETVYSEALVALCLRLLEKPTLTKAEALKTCYGISRYDALIHAPKLANTLTRANKLMKPIVELKTRGESVVATTLDSTRLILVGGSAHVVQLSRQREPILLGGVRAARTVSPSERALLTGFSEEWRPREEYERLLGVSKATATRRIQSWVREKLILKKGRGRQSRYKMVPALSESLIEGRGGI